jgi:hypothetical protein
MWRNVLIYNYEWEYHPIFLRETQWVMSPQDCTEYTITIKIVVSDYAEPLRIMTPNFSARNPQTLISSNTCYKS